MRIQYKFIFCIFIGIFLTEYKLFSSDTLQNASSSSYIKSLNLQYYCGNVIKTHEFVQGKNPQNKAYGLYNSFSAQYGIHTDGRKLWQQLYGYPRWGFGLNVAYFFDDNELGTPVSVYTFFNAPIKRWEKVSLNYEVQFGLAFNWKQHVPLENSYRYPVGSFSTVYFSAGLNATFHLSDHIDFSGGFAFNHYSNGSLKLPNYGLNLFAPSIGINYIFKKRPEFKKVEKPKYKKEWEWLILIAPSMRQLSFEYYDSDSNYVAEVFKYKIFTLSTGINWQLANVLKIGAGFDFTYNEAYAADTIMVNAVPRKDEFNESDKFLLGVYPSVEILINRVSIILQPGFYLYGPESENDKASSTYQRIGIKYHFTEHFFAGVNVRAYDFTKADFIEANIGYRLKWRK